MILLWALYAAGVFAVVLGVLHFTFPERFGFREVISPSGPPVPPFRLGFYQYPFRRDQLLGVIRVMNHCVSYTILSIGILDLFAHRWLGTPAGVWAALWVGGFWMIRAGTQLLLGRSPGDWLIVGVFAAFSVVHVVAVFPS